MCLCHTQAADTQHQSMAEKKQAASYTHAYKIYTMELSYLWNSMEPTKKALYEKQAELANALRAKHPGLDLKEYLAKLPGVKKLLGELPCVSECYAHIHILSRVHACECVSFKCPRLLM